MIRNCVHLSQAYTCTSVLILVYLHQIYNSKPIISTGLQKICMNDFYEGLLWGINLFSTLFCCCCCCCCLLLLLLLLFYSSYFSGYLSLLESLILSVMVNFVVSVFKAFGQGLQ